MTLSVDSIYENCPISRRSPLLSGEFHLDTEVTETLSEPGTPYENIGDVFDDWSFTNAGQARKSTKF